MPGASNRASPSPAIAPLKEKWGEFDLLRAGSGRLCPDACLSATCAKRLALREARVVRAG